MTAPAPTIRDIPDLIQACREIVEQENISREAIDDIVGWSDGYASKLLTFPPMKNIGPKSLFELIGAIGCAVTLVPDEKAAARLKRVARRYAASAGKQQRNPKREWRNTKALGMVRAHFKRLGRMGAIARQAKLSPEQRQRSARKAVRARWRRYRKLKKQQQQHATIS